MLKTKQKSALKNRRLSLERLEDRRMMTVAPAGVGPLPSVAAGLTVPQVSHADAVIDWNATMLRALWNTASPPTAASRTEAMVAVAVFDAVNGIVPTAQSYPIPGLTGQPAAGASAEAAAIAAADTVLTALMPTQQSLFNTEYAAMIANVPSGNAQSQGLAWGTKVADAMLAWRSTDGSTASSTYQPAPAGGTPGVYELTPPAYKPALGPQWGQQTPWTMTSDNQFLPPPPPALNSPEYAAAFNQVKSLGGTNSTTRTPDETLYAHFWADVPGNSVTPPGHWDEIAEHLSLQTGLSLVQNARLFALLNLGMGDAAISCWNAKYYYNMWRPVTAINDPRAAQINPATASDPTWTPLWSTPNFPSYASGHSTFSGAASVILSSVFGANTSFTVGSDDMPGYSRSYTSLEQAAFEAGFSRVVGGIHFSFDNTAALAAGGALGSYVIHTMLLPTPSLPAFAFPAATFTIGPIGPVTNSSLANTLLLGLSNTLLTTMHFQSQSAPYAGSATSKQSVQTSYLKDLTGGAAVFSLQQTLTPNFAGVNTILDRLQADAVAYVLVQGALPK